MSGRVADLQRRIAAGKYRVPAGLIAEKLMERMLSGGHGLRPGRVASGTEE